MGAIQLWMKNFSVHALLSLAFWAYFALELWLITQSSKLSGLGALILAGITGVLVVGLSMFAQRFHQYVVIWSNCWYWLFGAVTNVWWGAVLPMYLVFHGNFPINTIVMLSGAALLAVFEWGMTTIVKGWAGETKSTSGKIIPRMKEVYLFRSYQNWLV
jgi:hypothetical protein